MKLGIIAPPTEESYQLAANKGLEFLEFCINVMDDVDQFTDKVDQLKAWGQRYGVGVQSVGRWGSDRIGPDGSLVEDELQKSYRLIDAAQALGCENFVCGCNYVDKLSFYDNCSAAIRYFSTLIQYGADKGVKISAYNCHWNNFVHDHAAWTAILDQLPALGIKFDPSHSRYAARDYLKEMKDWGHRFNHVHIKGSLIIDGQRFDDPPAGLDQTDWGSFVAVLYAHGYQGGLSIEPHSHVWTGALGQKGIDFTIHLMNQFLFRK